MNKKIKIEIAAGIILVVAIIIGGALWIAGKKTARLPSGTEKQIPEVPGYLCPADALACPDGSFVGRTGPNCEFTQCPIDSEAGLEKKVFHSQNECEKATGKKCSFQMCDLIPPGNTYQEACGKDFQKGWTPNEPKPCIDDAKLCPDGSYVSRKPPTCEFEACPILSEKDGVYNLFRDMASWSTEDKVMNSAIEACKNPKDCLSNPPFFNFEMTWGPGDPDKGPNIQVIQKKLLDNGWVKCSEAASQPPLSEIYIKNCRKLKLNVDGSMGVGYRFHIVFDYE